MKFAAVSIFLASLLLLPADRPAAQDLAKMLNDRISITAIVTDDGWNRPLRGPSAMFYDQSADELFITDPGNNRVVIYDGNLSPVFSFTHYVRDPSSERMIKGEPRDLVVNSRGEIILADNYVSYLDILDFRGAFIERLELNRLLNDTTLNVKPQCLAIDGNDNLYVATAGDVVGVIVLDGNFRFQRIIGRDAAGNSDFKSPLAIHVSDSILFVTDLYAEPTVKLFDTSGAYLTGFGAHDVDRADMSFPSGLTTMTDDETGKVTFWVVDGLRQVVKVFHDDGSFLAHVGGFGVAPGEFRYPTDIVSSGDSLFFILERVGNRIQRFTID